MRTRFARATGIAAVAAMLVALASLPVQAAGSDSLEVLKVDGRTVDLLLTFAPKEEVTADTPVAATLEVDGRTLGADARLVIDDTRPTTAILVLDASGSMKGDRITAAATAANSVPGLAAHPRSRRA